MNPTDPADPPRMRDVDPDAPLVRVLGAARDDGPDPDALARLAARLGPLLGPDGGEGGPGGGQGGLGGVEGGPGGPSTAQPTGAGRRDPGDVPSSPTPSISWSPKLGGSTLWAAGAAALVAAVIAVAPWRGTAPPEAPSEPAPASERAPSTAADAPPTVDQPAAKTTTRGSQPPASGTAAPPPPPPLLTPPLAGAPDAPPPAPTGDLTAEVRLLGAAQQALTTDAARALSLANEHAAQFPNGQLAQEREVVAIQALMTLGREAEAQARAQRFGSEWPSSAHNRRIDVITGE